MTRKQYETFIADPKDLPERDEICLFIKDLTPGPQKYNSRFVKALVSSSSEQLAGSEILFVRSFGGRKHPQIFAIKILEDLGHYLYAPPYTVHSGLFSPKKGT